MRLVAFLGLVALLTGCSYLQPASRYTPGENFGDGGATRCGYSTTVITDLPPCS